MYLNGYAVSKVIPVLIFGPFPEDLYQVLASIFLKEVHLRTWPLIQRNNKELQLQQRRGLGGAYSPKRRFPNRVCTSVADVCSRGLENLIRTLAYRVPYGLCGALLVVTT